MFELNNNEELLYENSKLKLELEMNQKRIQELELENESFKETIAGIPSKVEPKYTTPPNEKKDDSSQSDKG